MIHVTLHPIADKCQQTNIAGIVNLVMTGAGYRSTASLTRLTDKVTLKFEPREPKK